AGGGGGGVAPGGRPPGVPGALRVVAVLVGWVRFWVLVMTLRMGLPVSRCGVGCIPVGNFLLWIFYGE
ncbi:hypothetical protein, partial [Streptomyces acidiscabies]|uniref:hypothetical protein n=1 Tax=Streptomyces acidiscabies TaxID=42234 RepID=UPI001C4DCCF8